VAGGRQGATGFDPQRLRAAREAANLTRGALAEAAGVHVSSISEWEAGRQVPRVETVAALARALRIEPSALLEPIEGDALTLERLRATAGLSQQQTAEAAGMLRNTYSASNEARQPLSPTPTPRRWPESCRSPTTNSAPPTPPAAPPTWNATPAPTAPPAAPTPTPNPCTGSAAVTRCLWECGLAGCCGHRAAFA
jgi:transcriptional regulator with XRE-family HTH domain